MQDRDTFEDQVSYLRKGAGNAYSEGFEYTICGGDDNPPTCPGNGFGTRQVATCCYNTGEPEWKCVTQRQYYPRAVHRCPAHESTGQPKEAKSYPHAVPRHRRPPPLDKVVTSHPADHPEETEENEVSDFEAFEDEEDVGCGDSVTPPSCVQANREPMCCNGGNAGNPHWKCVNTSNQRSVNRCVRPHDEAEEDESDFDNQDFEEDEDGEEVSLLDFIKTFNISSLNIQTHAHGCCGS